MKYWGAPSVMHKSCGEYSCYWNNTCRYQRVGPRSLYSCWFQCDILKEQQHRFSVSLVRTSSRTSVIGDSHSKIAISKSWVSSDIRHESNDWFFELPIFNVDTYPLIKFHTSVTWLTCNYLLINRMVLVCWLTWHCIDWIEMNCLLNCKRD